MLSPDGMAAPLTARDKDWDRAATALHVCQNTRFDDSRGELVSEKGEVLPHVGTRGFHVVARLEHHRRAFINKANVAHVHDFARRRVKGEGRLTLTRRKHSRAQPKPLRQEPADAVILGTGFWRNLRDDVAV